ncbi:MAG TPA: (Fe-S)-binding protein, partial [Dehalococcoidales bacterium]|nr:(Fe-S)-binding protein [Dehalococcoidales bacterium]
QMCGACGASCNYAMDMEVNEPIQEYRIKAVAEGHTSKALDKVVDMMKKTNSMVPGTAAKRGDWAEGLDLKNFTQEKVDVIYFAGCQTSFNKDLWKLAQGTAKLLKKAGVNFGIGSAAELCCGGRAYQMGYETDFLAQAKKNMALIKKSGAKMLVTGCADCYNAFKVLYDKAGLKGDLQVLHTTECFSQLIKEGKLKPTKKVNLNVTYHDPCRLGRMGEPWIHWQGKKVPGDRFVFDPPKTYRRGTNGVYEPPREVLNAIPGIKLTEMTRIKEYAWCCGAGGGVIDSNPEFAGWTAQKRLDEAVSTGAEALVTACPWCEKMFNDTSKANSNLKVYDIVELLVKSV